MGIERVFMAATPIRRSSWARLVALRSLLPPKPAWRSPNTAPQVKQAVAGTGANKEQVMMMVMHLLKLTQKPQIDASDALAIALCHAHTRSSLVPMAGTARRRGGRLRL
jgi:crossover junction endodeoxyribonuclease RuvC